jgi:hypothetical protein
MQSLHQVLSLVLRVPRLHYHLAYATVTKTVIRTRIQTSSLYIWITPITVATNNPARSHCAFIPCSSLVPAYSCSSRPTPEDDAPFLPHKRGIATDTGAMWGTDVPVGPIKRRARVRHSASHPPPTIVHSSESHRNIFDRQNSVSTVDPSHDADSDSDGNATDDEYVPSPTLGASKRRRAPSTAIITGLPVSCKPFTASQTRPTKRARVPPPSRNKQASSPTAIEQAAASKKPTFICPECGWHQTNQRMPDFRRHLLTHTRSTETDTDKGWWCKGVLVKDAARHGVPKTAAQYLFHNDWRVGGCLRTFSRRDALKRHLDNPNVSCVGRPCEPSEERS